MAIVLWASPWPATEEAALHDEFKTVAPDEQQACEDANADIEALKEERRESAR